MKYEIDGRQVSISVVGEVITGDEVCILHADDDLLAGCPWQHDGYTVFELMDHAQFKLLREGLSELVREGLSYAGRNVRQVDFDLEKYHEYCTDDAMHIKTIDFLKTKAAINNFPVRHQLLDDVVSAACGVTVSCKVAHQLASGYFFLRLVRPFPHQDNNPPHKDVWLNHLRDCVNIYVPLAGSNEKSTLPLVPGSHLWSESKIPRTASGAIANGIKFGVPSVVMTDASLKMTRPRVLLGEAMLFSPYLIHGGAVNFNSDITRVSLEMRFWRCNPV